MNDKDSFLQKNIAPILAVAYTVFTFIVFIMVLTKQISATENIVFLIINSVTNIVMLIVGYYFGSSSGMKNLQKEMINKDKPTISVDEIK